MTECRASLHHINLFCFLSHPVKDCLAEGLRWDLSKQAVCHQKFLGLKIFSSHERFGREIGGSASGSDPSILPLWPALVWALPGWSKSELTKLLKVFLMLRNEQRWRSHDLNTS